MALSYEVYHDLVQALLDHPEWRAELRPLVLGEQILELPERFTHLEQRMEAGFERLEAAIARNSDDIVQNSRDTQSLAQQMNLLITRVDKIDGRVGNLDGGRLEERYLQHITEWFDHSVASPSRVSPFDIVEVKQAQVAGTLATPDRRCLADTDFFVRGRELGGGQDVVLAVEVSWTINFDDVTGADASASLLKGLGCNARGFVGGHVIDDQVRSLAERLGTEVDLRRPSG